MCTRESESEGASRNTRDPQSTISSWKCVQVANLVIGPDFCVSCRQPGPTLAKHMPLDYSHSSSLQLLSPLGFKAAEQLMNRGLDAAAATALASITPQNQQRRMQLAQELSLFLQQLPWQSDLQTCTPEELLVYLQLEYLPKHAGSRLPNGAVIAAPSTIATIISHLRMIFKTVGHGDIWQAEEAHGNPACSHQIKQWQQGGGKQSSKSWLEVQRGTAHDRGQDDPAASAHPATGHAQPRQVSL